MRPEDIHLTRGLKNALPTSSSLVPEKFWPFPAEANWRTNGRRRTFLRSRRAPQVLAADIVKMRSDFFFWVRLRAPICRCHSYWLSTKFRFRVFTFFQVSKRVALLSWKLKKSHGLYSLTVYSHLERVGPCRVNKGYSNSHFFFF